MAEKQELRFVSPRHVMFYEHVRGTGIKANYVGRSRVDSLFQNNSLSVIESNGKGIYGIVVLDGLEVEFSVSYVNERSYREGGKLCNTISRGDTMLFDELVILTCNVENDHLSEMVKKIKGFGFREAK